MAMVLAADTVFAELTLRENLGLGARLEPAEEVAARLERVLEVFPALRSNLGRRAGSLSGGEQRMAGVGIALMSDPSLLLLDEPTRFLAPTTARFLLDALRRLADERGLGVLLADVNVAGALSVSDRVYVMANGGIRSEHDPADLRAAGPASWWRLF
jgi:branched-chain amino acid transport system ATP-binding protein